MADKNTQQIPTGWREAILGDYISVKHGFAFKGEYFSEQENENVLLTPGNFNIGGGFKADKFKYYIGSFPEEYILHAGDLIVTMTDLSKDGDTLGYPAKVPRYENKNFLHNQRIGLVQFKREDLDRDFLYYLMHTRNYQKSIVNSASGSTVRHTSPDKIKEFRSLFPSLPEQRAIASVLSAFDDKIELLREQNKTLEAIAQTLFNRWFVEFNFPDESGQPYRDSGGKMIDSELGEIPDGWGVDKLGGYIDIRGGSTPSTSNPDFWNGDINWTSPKDLSDSREMFLLSTEKKITGEGLDQISSGLLPKYTLLLSSRAPIGYLAIATIETAINQGYIAFLPNAYFSNYFMYLWLGRNMNIVEGSANGTTFLEISKSSFRNIESVIPKEKILKDFDSIIKPIFTKILFNLCQIQTLSQLRDTLLPKLMHGEVRVKL